MSFCFLTVSFHQAQPITMLESLIAGFQSFMVALGLHTATRRFLFGSALGFGAQFFIKPSISYRKDGKAKSFGETFFPWYVISFVPGILLGLFL